MLKFATIVIFYCLVCFDFGQSKLILVHTVFRHGERTTDTKFMYPNDPHRNKTFFPYGNGQLTNVGKRTMYNLGKVLRERYNDFLGDTFLPEQVDAWASSLTRTQNALQLVLAALFPPNDVLLWNKDLKWQPVAYNSLPREMDTLLLPVLLPEFIATYKEYCKSDEAKEAMEIAEPVMSYIRKHAGSETSTPRDFFFTYITLITEDHYGLELPDWTKAIYPDPLTDLIHLEFDLQMGTKKLRQLLLGRLMGKMLEDTENAIAGKSERKMYFYSAHDVNIVYVLKLFELMYKHSPGYSACIALEVHEEEGRYFLQVHYKTDKDVGFELLRFPDGGDRLYIEYFRVMVEELLAEEPQIQYSIVNASSRLYQEYTVVYYQVIIMYIYFNFLR